MQNGTASDQTRAYTAVKVVAYQLRWHLRHLNPIWMMVHVLAVPFPIRPQASGMRKAIEDGPSVMPLQSTLEIQMKLWAAGCNIITVLAAKAI